MNEILIDMQSTSRLTTKQEFKGRKLCFRMKLLLKQTELVVDKDPRLLSDHELLLGLYVEYSCYQANVAFIWSPSRVIDVGHFFFYMH